MTRYCKNCKKLNPYPLNKFCSLECKKDLWIEYFTKVQKPLKRTELKRSEKPVKAISEKRKTRLSSYSEKDMFLEIWNERENVCEICNKKILEPSTYCFAHRCPKWTYPEHRLKKENISLVCSIKCHWEVDKIFSWIKRQEHIAFLNKSL